MSRMVGVSSYPAKKSLMGMDSPVRGEAKMRARDTRGTILQHPLWPQQVRLQLSKARDTEQRLLPFEVLHLASQ